MWLLWGKQNSNLNVLDGGFHACAGTQKAGRHALGALASAGPGAGEGGARRRCHARGAGPGAGARAWARWTRAGRLLVDRTVHLF